MLKLALWKERFGDHLSQIGNSPRTVESYTGELRALFDFLEAGQVGSLADVTRGHLEDYRSFLFSHEPPLKLKTQSLRMTAVKGFFRFLQRNDYLSTDPSGDLPTIRVPKSFVRSILTEEETLRLLEAPPTDSVKGLRDRAILEILYSCGIRNSELSSLKLGDLDFARSQLRVINGKGGLSRVLPLGREACDWTLAYLEKSRPVLLGEMNDVGFVFLSQRGKKLDREGLADLVGQAGQWAGITRRVTPHVLRHSVATHMLARQAGIRYIQQLLGHQSLNSTQVYAQVEISALQRMHQRFHPREQA